MKTVEQDSRWKIDEETGFRWYKELGAVIVEMELDTPEHGVGLIHNDTPFIILRKGITERQAELVKAQMLAQLYLGYAGPWEGGGISDRRYIPPEAKKAAIEAFVREYLS